VNRLLEEGRVGAASAVGPMYVLVIFAAFSSPNESDGWMSRLYCPNSVAASPVTWRMYSTPTTAKNCRNSPTVPLGQPSLGPACACERERGSYEGVSSLSV
jgi:hypothetical protein